MIIIIILFVFGVGLAFMLLCVVVTALAGFLTIKRGIMGQPLRGRNDPRWYDK